MKLLGLKLVAGKGGRPAGDADVVADLALKPGARLMMMGWVVSAGWWAGRGRDGGLPVGSTALGWAWCSRGHPHAAARLPAVPTAPLRLPSAAPRRRTLRG